MATIAAQLLAIASGVAILTVGILIITLPPETQMRFDRMGSSLYAREMERSGDRERALRAARSFYRWFGGFFVMFGGLWLFAAIGEALGLFGE